MKTELRKGINWVGYVDWVVRDFHGYQTPRGSTYNAYLVQDEKTAVIDSVKAPYAEEYIARIRALTKLEAINYIVCNHAEPDHSGSIMALQKLCPDAEIVCNEKCRKALQLHYDTAGWSFRIVASGDSISLGTRTLTFVETPMVHWPESMFTYVPEEKLLFSMDAFGQHYASAHRFDDEEPLDVIMHEAKTYYANIVMLYSKPIARVLDKARGLDIEMIAPSHGVIWRKNLSVITSAYVDWVNFKPAPKVVILYDTMWQSTERMAKAIVEGAQETEAHVRLINVRSTHMTETVTEVLDAATLAIGSPTLNQTLMPQVAAVLTYLKGLKPGKKAGFAFGSYGWAKSATKEIETYMDAMKIERLREPLDAQFVPNDDALAACRQAGRELAEAAIERASG